jgi:hypothetical protein
MLILNIQAVGNAAEGIIHVVLKREVITTAVFMLMADCSLVHISEGAVMATKEKYYSQREVADCGLAVREHITKSCIFFKICCHTLFRTLY